MIVSIHQPNFLPWIGFFSKVLQSDVFVLLDNVQYTKNSFINRNRIKTPQGVKWLTVPVRTKARFGQLIKEVEINKNVDWRQQHLKTLEMCYKRSKFFGLIFKNITDIYYKCSWSNLAVFNIELLNWLFSLLEINTKIILASQLNVKGKGTDLLINIVKAVNGDTYLSGFGGVNYQNEELFKINGIKLRYYEFSHPIYPQLWGDFVPNLSIIDLLFNCGPSFSRDILMGNK